MQNTDTIITVVIATYNSSALVKRALKSIEQIDYPKAKFEVVVIDDGSTDDTKYVVESFKSTTDMQLNYFKQKNQGPGMARNTGIDQAKGRIIAITDADCIVDKNWLKAIERAILQQKKALVCGRTYCNEVLIFPWVIAPAGQVRITANLAYDKAVLPDARFDPQFKGLLGQDTAFVLRAEDQGHPFTYVPEMRILHPANILGLKGVIRRAWARSDEVLLYKIYGNRVKDAMHPLFRPIILGRLSLVTIGFFAFWLLMILAIVRGHAVDLLAAIIIIILIFIAYGYRLLLSGPDMTISIPWSQRLRTLAYLALYVPVFVWARGKGSITYRYLVF